LRSVGVMLVCVLLGGMLRMLDSVKLVTMGQMRMMTGRCMIAGLGVPGRFTMMLGSFFQMFCRFVVMMMNLVLGVHATLLDRHAPDPASRAWLIKQSPMSRL
jgi:hypothetical protein